MALSLFNAALKVPHCGGGRDKEGQQVVPLGGGVAAAALVAGTFRLQLGVAQIVVADVAVDHLVDVHLVVLPDEVLQVQARVLHGEAAPEYRFLVHRLSRPEDGFETDLVEATHVGEQGQVDVAVDALHVTLQALPVRLELGAFRLQVHVAHVVAAKVARHHRRHVETHLPQIVHDVAAGTGRVQAVAHDGRTGRVAQERYGLDAELLELTA